MCIACLFSHQVMCQMVTGVVSADDGGTLPGASVMIKGTSAGVVTDIDGSFEIDVEVGATLLFSYIGYKKKEVLVTDQTVINVVLDLDVAALREVIVVGYGSQGKSDITGSLASLKPKEIVNLPVSTTDQALQGRVAGVNIQSNDASPNSETRIRIRGSNSLLGNNDPLVVIDGFQDGSLKLVHPMDIASVEVLKDASALAIYGSKGANGAILVTTKSGGTLDRNGPVINYSSYTSRHSIRNKLRLLDAQQYATRQNQDALELGGSQPFSAEQIAEFQSNGGTDWQDEIFRTAWAHNHHLSIAGKSDKVNYFASGDVLDQEGVILGSEFRRYSFRGNLGIRPTEKLELNLNTLFSHTNDSPVTLNTFSGENSGSPVNSALLWSPTDPVFSDVLTQTYTLPAYDPDVGPLTDYNPVALAAEPERTYLRFHTVVNGSLSYEPISGLKFKVLGGLRLIDDENSEFINNKPTQVQDSETASIYNAKNLFAQTSYIASYNFDAASHSFDITGLYEEQYNEFNDSWLGARGFISDAVRFDNLGLGQSVFPLSSNRTKRSLRSYMSRVNYSFDSRYLLTLTARWDGSTVFGDANKWAFFPSVALGWNVTNERFFENSLDVISYLKIRTSFGQTGSQAIAPGGSIGLIGDTFTYPLNGPVVSPGIGIADRAANPDLKWETTKQFNVGIDLELFEGRINVTTDYYIKETNDLLFERPIAQASGASTQFVNVGAMENRGIEMLLEAKVIDKEFKWTSGFNFSRNRNKVLELLDGATELPIGSVGFPGFDNFIWLEVGQPIGQFRGVKFDGVWQANEADEAALFGAIPGSPKAVDQNGDMVIDEQDIVVLGNSQPNFSYGWNNTFQFKNFDLNIFIQGVQGIDKLNLSKLQLLRGTGADLLNRWTPTNTNTEIPSAIGEAVYSIGNSDRFIEDASYVRIKNISLGYQLPRQLMDALGMSEAKVYVSGYNLFTFTNYSGYDPESTRSSEDFASGVDLATYPEQKIYTLGINITF